MSCRTVKAFASHAAVPSSSLAEVALIYTMHVALMGYCPWGWGLRPVNWIYRLWRHCQQLLLVYILFDLIYIIYKPRFIYRDRFWLRLTLTEINPSCIIVTMVVSVTCTALQSHDAWICNDIAIFNLRLEWSLFIFFLNIHNSLCVARLKYDKRHWDDRRWYTSSM